ncbi:MAG: hypothetical protein ACOZAN_02455 [Patescibacteria group bacterium]
MSETWFVVVEAISICMAHHSIGQSLEVTAGATTQTIGVKMDSVQTNHRVILHHLVCGELTPVAVCQITRVGIWVILANGVIGTFLYQATMQPQLPHTA